MNKVLVACVLVGACGGDDGATPEPDAEPAATATPIFLNRGGGTYVPGANNARTNTSSVLTAEIEFGAYTVEDGRWADQLDHLRTMFAPFDVQIVDENPGTVPHHEVLMVAPADWPQVIMQDNVGGISPFSCMPIANSISFVNPEVFGIDDYAIAWTAAQGVGNSAGLDIGFSCPDVMTYLDTCGPDKSFTDEDVACGEFEARNCCTGQATQNSYQTLIEVFGAAP